MTESTSVTAQQMLFQKALERANGPMDAEHIAYVIMLATGDDSADAKQELIEMDFLLLLLVNQIRMHQPAERSFENIYELLTDDQFKDIEAILRISEFWKSAKNVEALGRSIAKVKARLLRVLLADDPYFVA
ncbi:MAG: hypothetical protein K2X81_04390 [Candidatus Obscuribacterales bacterium]|nr:hypothetical protein [Candidatus Obscuribacterales bacterium]